MPLTAATIGFDRRSMLRTTAPVMRVKVRVSSSSASSSGAMISSTSPPPQKPRPAPVSSSTRTVASSRTRPSASRTSACIASLKLLSRSGRLSVSRAMPPSIANRMFS